MEDRARVAFGRAAGSASVKSPLIFKWISSMPPESSKTRYFPRRSSRRMVWPGSCCLSWRAEGVAIWRGHVTVTPLKNLPNHAGPVSPAAVAQGRAQWSPPPAARAWPRLYKTTQQPQPPRLLSVVLHPSSFVLRPPSFLASLQPRGAIILPASTLLLASQKNTAQCPSFISIAILNIHCWMACRGFRRSWRAPRSWASRPWRSPTTV